MEVVRTQEMSFLSFTGGDETTAMFVHLTQKALTFNTRNKIIIKVFCGHKLPLTRGLISFNGDVCCNRAPGLLHSVKY